MTDRIALIKADVEGDKVRLTFSDGDSFYVSYKDYNRTLMTFINGDKESLRRDFAIWFQNNKRLAYAGLFFLSKF